MRRTIRVLAAMTFLAAVSGCTTASAGQAFDLVEFAVNGPTTLTSNIGSVNVTNSGEFPHTLVVTDSTGEVVAATSLIRPGESTALEVDLDPGHQYSFTCRIVSETSDGRIVDHFEAGMHTTVTIEG